MLNRPHDAKAGLVACRRAARFCSSEALHPPRKQVKRLHPRGVQCINASSSCRCLRAAYARWCQKAVTHLRLFWMAFFWGSQCVRLSGPALLSLALVLSFEELPLLCCHFFSWSYTPISNGRGDLVPWFDASPGFPIRACHPRHSRPRAPWILGIYEPF